MWTFFVSYILNRKISDRKTSYQSETQIETTYHSLSYSYPNLQPTATNEIEKVLISEQFRTEIK